MENDAWYKEKWATDLMGIIAKEVFKKPAEEPIISPQSPDLGAKFEAGDWTVAIVVVSIVALILLFFFLKKGRR